MKLDPRVAFYLEHQALIDQWLSLPALYHREAHKFFASLRPEIEELAEGLGDDVRVWAYLERKKRGGIPPLYVLYRTSWVQDARKAVVMGVALEWPKKAPSFTNAFSGVRVHVDKTEAHVRQREALLRAAAARVQAGEYETGESWWPVWRYLKPEREACWSDLDALRAQALSQLGEDWRRLAPLIDEVLSAED